MTAEASAEMKESLAREIKSLEEAKASISQVKYEALEERKAKETLQNECDTLKTDLSRQKTLNEAERKTFLSDKKKFVETIKDLQQKNENLERVLKCNSEQVDQLKTEIKSMKEDVSR